MSVPPAPALDDRLIRKGHRSLAEWIGGLVDPSVAALALILVTVLQSGSLRPVDAVLAVIAFAISNPGDPLFDHRPVGQAWRLIGRWVLRLGLLLAFGLVSGFIEFFDTGVLAAWALLTAAVQVSLHALGPALLARLGLLHPPDTTVIVGAGALGRSLAQRLAASPGRRSEVVGFFDDRSSSRLGAVTEATVHGPIDAVADFVRAQSVHRIYIALPMASQPRILRLLDQLRDTTASIYFVPDIFLADIIQGRVDTVAGLPVVAVCESPFHGATGLIKRCSDIALASLAIALTAPVMLGIAAAIKLTMPGPVLFRQRRYGLDGEQIVVWKFRSMRVQEDGAVVTQARRDDDRVTPLGRFLRRSSLDELPQFFNVLQGRMSVVGPRPHAVAHNEQYRRLIKGYMIRHKVRPGITGWAQVNGARGETQTVQQMRRRIELDLAYLRSWSLRLDALIVWKTVLLALRGDRNAY